MNPNDNIFIKANIQQLAPVPGDRQSEGRCGLLNILQVWTSKVLVSQILQDFANPSTVWGQGSRQIQENFVVVKVKREKNIKKTDIKMSNTVKACLIRKTTLMETAIEYVNH